MTIERIITAILNEEVEIFYQGARVTVLDLDELQDRRHRIHKLLSQKWRGGMIWDAMQEFAKLTKPIKKEIVYD